MQTTFFTSFLEYDREKKHMLSNVFFSFAPYNVRFITHLNRILIYKIKTVVMENN